MDIGLTYLAGLCERVVNIEKYDRVLDRPVLERWIYRRCSSHCEGCVVPEAFRLPVSSSQLVSLRFL